MYKLLIIDDEPLVQVGIRSMVHWEELNIEVCGVASNGQQGLSLIEEEMPDIVITDIKMPLMSGLELLSECRRRYGNIRPAFIILTGYEDFQLAKEAISHSVIDYLVKIELTPEVLTATVEKALEMIRASGSALPVSEALNQRDLQVLKDKFFIRLLHDLFDSEEQFRLLQEDLGIPFNSAFYRCCYFELVNHKAEDLSIDRQITLYSNSLHLLQENTLRFREAYFVTLDRKHGAMIFFADTEEALAESTLYTMLTQMSDTLFGYYSTGLKCGIGQIVSSPLAVSDSYLSARSAFGSITEDVGVSGCGESDADTNAHTVFNISILKEDLSRAYSEYDADLLREVLGKLITLFNDYPSHYLQTLDAACNVLYLGLSLIPDGEEVLSSLFADMPDGYRSIYRQKNTVQITAWLETYRDRLCEVFENRKKEHRHHTVESVKKYIDAHLKDRLTLNEVSAVYGISPNYLSSLFKKYSDLGYSEYITWRKIEEAKKLMSEGTLKVYEIADALGFESAFYFSKVFKKVEGISPTEYLNK
ncbi:MAG: AraC family transcriptional regulator [Lachnospiraceae bacterium]|nr:AraC family transcriptional regulator [Lachnospiraceae bacterium]